MILTYSTVTFNELFADKIQLMRYRRIEELVLDFQKEAANQGFVNFRFQKEFLAAPRLYQIPYLLFPSLAFPCGSFRRREDQTAAYNAAGLILIGNETVEDEPNVVETAVLAKKSDETPEFRSHFHGRLAST